jgi:ribosomal protein S4
MVKQNVVQLLAKAGFAESLSMGRRMVFQGAVQVDGKPVTEISTELDVVAGETRIKVGKREAVVGEV